MRYSLVTRFRGVLLGAVIGVSLAQVGHKNNRESSESLARVIIPGGESLIHLGKFEIDDWLIRYQAALTPSSVTDNVKLNTAETIFATIPVALFFHENPVKLRQNLLAALKIGQDDPILRDSAIAIGYAIAQCLTEKLRPHSIIPEIISFIGETESLVPEKLLTVHKLLLQGASVEKLKAQLSREEKLSYTVAVAFYCFLSTLEDFRLSVLRAAKLEFSDTYLTTAIAGALSGSYNSTVGIPMNWQVALLSTDSTVKNKSNLSQVLELGDALAAVWSGVYDIALHSREIVEPGCILSNSQVSYVYAAPRLIRGS